MTKTPEQIHAFLLSRLEQIVERADDVIADHAKKLSEDPFSALEWSDKVFTVVAERRVAQEIRAIAEHFGPLDTPEKRAGMEREILDRALRAASSSTRSTSAGHNEINRCLGVEWSNWARRTSFML